MFKTKKGQVAMMTLLGFLAGSGYVYANHIWYCSGTTPYHWASATVKYASAVEESPGGKTIVRSRTDYTRAFAGSTALWNGTIMNLTTGTDLKLFYDTYGRNGWLGVASIWASGSHITKATVKLNDTYYNTAQYNTKEWRRSVLCQEVGHTFGLGHQSEDPTVNTGSCMDYYQVPNIAPNAHDYAQLASIYSHTGETATVSSAATTTRRGLVRVREGIYVEDFGNGHRRVVFVSWRDQDQQHLAAPAGV